MTTASIGAPPSELQWVAVDTGGAYCDSCPDKATVRLTIGVGDPADPTRINFCAACLAARTDFISDCNIPIERL